MTPTATTAKLLEKLIGGRRVAAATVEAVDVLDPATGEFLARAPLSGAADVDRAARAAQDAWPALADTPGAERARVMFRLRTRSSTPVAPNKTSACGSRFYVMRGGCLGGSC